MSSPESAPARVTSRPSRIQVMPSATITSVWKGPKGSASRRAGISVSMIVPERAATLAACSERRQGTSVTRSDLESGSKLPAGEPTITECSRSGCRRRAPIHQRLVLASVPANAAACASPPRADYAFPSEIGRVSVSLRRLARINDAPNGSARVLRHQQGSIFIDSHSHRPAPDLKIVDHEAGDEVFVCSQSARHPSQSRE